MRLRRRRSIWGLTSLYAFRRTQKERTTSAEHSTDAVRPLGA